MTQRHKVFLYIYLKCNDSEYRKGTAHDKLSTKHISLENMHLDTLSIIPINMLFAVTKPVPPPPPPSCCTDLTDDFHDNFNSPLNTSCHFQANLSGSFYPGFLFFSGCRNGLVHSLRLGPLCRWGRGWWGVGGRERGGGYDNHGGCGLSQRCHSRQMKKKN